MMIVPTDVLSYFPYDGFRPGQEEVLKKIHDVVSEGSHLILEAANGFGKTITSLAAVLPIARENDLKIVYLCRTHAQNQRVIEELSEVVSKSRIKGTPLELGALGLRGRAAMCFDPYVLENNPDAGLIQLICRQLRRMRRCKYYKNHDENPTNVQDVLFQMSKSPMDGSDLIQVCRVWELCPYFISREALASDILDVIACNFQWLVNPSIREVFLQNLGTPLDRIILIVDEAHNLPRVATDVSSLSLTFFSNRQMISEAKKLKLDEFEEFGNCVEEIFEIFQKKKVDEMDVSPDLFIKKFLKLGIIDLPQFFLTMISEGEAYRESLLRQNKFPRSYLFSSGMFWVKFLNKMGSDSYYYGMSRVRMRDGRENQLLEILSLDPSEIIRPLLDQVYASIHMSGTINLEAYKDVLNFPSNVETCSMPSPFTENQSIVLCLRGVSTKNDDRTPQMYQNLADRCIEAIRCIPKNVGIFCASYEVLRNLKRANLIKEIKQVGKKVFIERPDMTSADNDSMFVKYKQASKKDGAVLLGVCGGRNAEGQDFPGDFMNGSIIVGVPFARPTKKVKAIISYYSRHWGDRRGKELGYFINALQRASQAAGRPIRKLEDRGSIVLLDHRFSSGYFKRFLSSWLKEQMIILENRPEEIESHLRTFWEK